MRMKCLFYQNQYLESPNNLFHDLNMQIIYPFTGCYTTCFKSVLRATTNLEVIICVRPENSVK